MMFSFLVACGSAFFSLWLEEGIPSANAGTSVFGRDKFVEYIVGDSPNVISVPHGGRLEPKEIPDRLSTTQERFDTNTVELAFAIAKAIKDETGKRPHLIINWLHRKKMDANRDDFQAAQDDSLALRAWREYHEFIDTAMRDVERSYGRGLYIDLHGHNHHARQLELGYLLPALAFQAGDEALDSDTTVEQNSARAFARAFGYTTGELIRGSESLGTLYEEEGASAVPSKGRPVPDRKAYFSGGYNLERHSLFNRVFFGVQIETPFGGVRDSPESHQKFARATAQVLKRFAARYLLWKP
jgi:N-formylglutamate amidohydrolase